MSYLQPINRLSETNLGGIVEIQLARAADIDTMQDPVDGTVYGDITFIGGAGFVKWYPTSQTAEVVTNNKDSDDGDYKTKRLPFMVAKDKSDVRHQFQIATEDEFVVLFKDSNGRTKVFGNKEYPVKFQFNHASSRAVSGKNGYTCEFVYEGPDNEFFYEGAISQAPAGPGSNPITWNGVVIGSAQPGEVIQFISDFNYTDFNINLNIS